MSKPVTKPKTGFDPELHRYTLDGRIIPHVSLILAATGISPDWRKVDPIVLERKRLLGTALHKCLHFLQENDLDESSVDPDVVPYLEGYKLFVKDTGFVAQQVEVRRWPEINGMPYGGTLDVVGMLWHEPALVDFKSTSNSPLPSWGVQLSAYEQGIEPPLVPPFRYRRYSLQLLNTGKYQLTEWTDPSDLGVFKWALALTWWKINHGNEPWLKESV